MDGLQAQFQAHISAPGIALDQVKDRIGHTIRPGADGQADDQRMVQGLVVKLPQLRHRRVGIGGRLEVGQEALGAIALLQQTDAAGHLIADRTAGQTAIGTEAAIVAEDATTHGHGAIHVGTGKAGVDGDAINPAAETFTEETAERPVAALRREASGHDGGSHDRDPLFGAGG